MRFIYLLLVLSALLGCQRVKGHTSDNRGVKSNKTVVIPLGGNTWISSKNNEGGKITNEGISDWSDKNISFTTYVRIDKKGKIKLWGNLRVPKGQSNIQISLLNRVRRINASNHTFQDKYLGEWDIHDTGYVAITFKALSKTSNIFADIRSIKLSGSVVDDHTYFVKNNKGHFFYWGRRGPSVHLDYIIPDNKKIEWFLDEIRVPKGSDVLGSYFMADGFKFGYFGMQVNSPTRRHILFSVWSPYKTNNPTKIPDSLRIKLIRKGKNVHAGKFGDEGSGGQSYLKYPWKAGKTYKFLLKAKPDKQENATTFTAWFYAPEKSKWLLIASFKRPDTDQYLTGLYSFLENFIPKQGDKTRRGYFKNAWIRTIDGNWIQLTKAKFTGDNTARKHYRMDYKGGTKNNEYYLQNCGFFNNYTPLGSVLRIKTSDTQPKIRLSYLP
ncbi:MAG TPA: DUF3472 domain-containing protein [Balneolales bacterium]|nr:DUF3472 domain-containing protein [Balneolales bacterium]